MRIGTTSAIAAPPRKSPQLGEPVAGQDAERAGAVPGVVERVAGVDPWVVRVAGRLAVDEVALEVEAQVRRHRGVAGVEAGVEVRDHHPLAGAGVAGRRPSRRELRELAAQVPGDLGARRQGRVGRVDRALAARGREALPRRGGEEGLLEVRLDVDAASRGAETEPLAAAGGLVCQVPGGGIVGPFERGAEPGGGSGRCRAEPTAAASRRREQGLEVAQAQRSKGRRSRSQGRAGASLHADQQADDLRVCHRFTPLAVPGRNRAFRPAFTGRSRLQSVTSPKQAG